MDTLGVYISVPFCRSKCSYCNFASGVFPEAYHERYIERVIEDIRGSRAQVAEFPAVLPEVVDSVYLGGGTPSILSPKLLKSLFRTLKSTFNVTNSAEITLECAPGQIEDDVLAAMVECGVNRVSFGVQSFIDREAAVTGRLHNRHVAMRDIERVRSAGIQSINADLIAGLPHQTPASWRESLDVLIASGVDHASVYVLEVDENSRLGRELMDGGARYHAGSVATDDAVADFYLEAIEILRGSGFAHYEISNFARPGKSSIHNEKYWRRQPYIGFGLDAHSMLRTEDGEAIRFQTGDDLQPFLDSADVVDTQPVPSQQALEESWFLGLRLNWGVSLDEVEREFGEANLDGYAGLIEELSGEGLVELVCGRVSLTDRGRLLSNEVFERFLGEHAAAPPELVTID
jgi:oxygen-independent coproporphyrinogen-3 oxidase